MSTHRWLLLRGMAREQRHWGAFASTFATALHSNTSCLDLPGFGTQTADLSPTSIGAIVDDTRARFTLLRAQHPGDTWSILAISLGGMVTLDWLARYPADFSRAVVINTSAADLSVPTERFKPRNYPRIVRAIFGSALVREQQILSFTMNNATVDKATLAVTWAKWGEQRKPMRMSFFRQLYAGATAPLPRRITVPVLVLASRADRLVSYRCSEKIAHALQAPLALHDEAGHDLSADAPQWIADQVSQWLLPRVQLNVVTGGV